MPETKRVMVSVPENLLAELDGLASLDRCNRSQIIREAMQLYLAERRRYVLREQMKKGYQEMAEINLTLALENYEGEV